MGEEPEFRQNSRNEGAEYALNELKKTISDVVVDVSKGGFLFDEKEVLKYIERIEDKLDELIELTKGNWL